MPQVWIDGVVHAEASPRRVLTNKVTVCGIRWATLTGGFRGTEHRYEQGNWVNRKVDCLACIAVEDGHR